MTAGDPGRESLDRVISCLVGSVPGLDTAGAQSTLRCQGGPRAGAARVERS